MSVNTSARKKLWRAALGAGLAFGLAAAGCDTGADAKQYEEHTYEVTTVTTLAAGGAVWVPMGIAVGPDGYVYFGGDWANAICRIDPYTGAVETWAGDQDSDGSLVDGSLADARFNRVMFMTFAGDGTLYALDNGNAVIRKIANGQVSTLDLTWDSGIETAKQALNYPNGIVASPDGNTLYVLGNYEPRILKIALNAGKTGGTVTLLGGGVFDGKALAYPPGPGGIAIDGDGNLYVPDTYNDSRVLKITPEGTATVIAGGASGAWGYIDGPAADAKFNAPGGAAVAADGTIYVADQGNNVIRKIAPVAGGGYTVTTAAGTGEAGDGDGLGAEAAFGKIKDHDGNSATEDTLVGIFGIALSADGKKIYVADKGNDAIRVVSFETSDTEALTGSVAVIDADNDAKWEVWETLTADATKVTGDGELSYQWYKGDDAIAGATAAAYVVKAADVGGMLRVAVGRAGYPNTIKSNAPENPVPQPVTISGIPKAGKTLTVAVADLGTTAGETLSYQWKADGTDIENATETSFTLTAGQVDKKISVTVTGSGHLTDPVTSAETAAVVDASTAVYMVSTLATITGAAEYPYGVAVGSDGTVYFGSDYGNGVWKIDASGDASGVDALYAGSADPDTRDTTDGGLLDARFNRAMWPTIAADGTMYVLDNGNSAIRKIAGGQVSTLTLTWDSGAGWKSDAYPFADSLNYPNGIAVSPDGGTLYVAGSYNHRVLKIALNAGKTGGTVTPFGEWGDTKPNYLGGIAVDGDGNVYVSDTYNNGRIAKITPAGVVSNAAGGWVGDGGANGWGSADGPAATVAQFKDPGGLAVGSDGVIYVADRGNNTIRVISGGVVSTLAGDGTQGDTDGAAAQARFKTVWGIAVTPDGTLYVADKDNHSVRKIVRE